MIDSFISVMTRNVIRNSFNNYKHASKKKATGQEYYNGWSDNVFNASLGYKNKFELQEVQTAYTSAMTLTALMSHHKNALNEMRSSLVEISSLVTNLSGNWSEELRDSSDPVINQLLTQVKNISENTTFENLKLLDGTIGGSYSNNLIPASSLSSTSLTLSADDSDLSSIGIGGFKGKSFDVTNLLVNGDKISVGDLEFTFKNLSSQNTDIIIGDTSEETARNFVSVANGLSGNIADESNKYRFERVGSKIFVINNVTGGSEPSVSSQTSSLNAIDNIDSAGGERQSVITISSKLDVGEYIEINGVKFTAHSDDSQISSNKFDQGSSAGDSAAFLVGAIYNSIERGGVDAEKLSKFSYRVDGSKIYVTAKENGFDEKTSKYVEFTSSKISQEDHFGATKSYSHKFTFTGADSEFSELLFDGISFTGAGSNDFTTGAMQFKADAADTTDRATDFINFIDELKANHSGTVEAKIINNYVFLQDGASVIMIPKEANKYSANFVQAGALSNINYLSSDDLTNSISDFSAINDPDFFGEIKYQNILRSVASVNDLTEVNNIRAEYNLAAFTGASSRAVEFLVKIGDEFYTALASYDSDSLGALLDDNQVIFKKLGETGPDVKTFSIGLATSLVQTSFNNQTELDDFITEVTTDLEKISVNQKRYLKTATSSGDIVVNNQMVGSLNGFSASLSSQTLEGRVENVKIEYLSLEGKLKYEVNINGKIFSLEESVISDNATRPNRIIRAGEIITLRTSDKKDFLRIMVGNRDVDLTNDTSIKAVTTAWKGGLYGGFNNARFVSGPSMKNKFEVDLSDMRWSIIADNSSLSIDTLEDALASEQIIIQAIAKIDQELAKNTGYTKGLNAVTAHLDVMVENLSSATENLLTTDYLAAKRVIEDSLNKIEDAHFIQNSKRRLDELLLRILNN